MASFEDVRDGITEHTMDLGKAASGGHSVFVMRP
jgi:hypothetical protein